MTYQPSADEEILPMKFANVRSALKTASALSAILLFALATTPAANGVGFYNNPAVNTYLDSSGFRQVMVWLRGDDGHLYAHYLHPDGWHTDDHGTGANGVGFYSNPAVNTYVDSSGFTQVMVWLTGDDGHLYVHYLHPDGWHTDDHEADANGLGFAGNPAVNTYVDSSGFTQVMVWLTGNDGHLYAHYLHPDGWHTDDHGSGANGARFFGTPAVNTYVDSNGFNQVMVWLRGNDGHLYAHYLHPDGWYTDDHGTGAKGVTFYGDPAVNTYVDGSGFNEVMVWLTGNDGHLYVHYLNRQGWHTDDHGTGGNGVTFYANPAVNTYLDSSGFNQVMVWLTGNDFHLYAHYLYPDGWHTDDHGTGSNSVLFSGNPAVNTYLDSSGFNEVMVWLTGANGDLYAHYLNQEGWHTDDHGS
jgi:hypothetical protein